MTDTPTVKVAFDIDSLTLGDIEDFKSHTGRELGDLIGSMQSLGDDPAAGITSDLAVGLATLVWLTVRRSDPGCTLAAVKRLPLAQVMAILRTGGDGGDADPSPGGDGGDADPLPVGDRPELSATGSSPGSGSPATGG